MRLLLRKNPVFAALPHREPSLRAPVSDGAIAWIAENLGFGGLGISSTHNYIVGRHESSAGWRLSSHALGWGERERRDGEAISQTWGCSSG